MSLVSRAVRDYTDLTRRLADLIVGFGANVQPGQLVGVASYLGKEELTREIARAAYERGALYVDVLYWDQWVKRQRLLHGDSGDASATSLRGCATRLRTSPTSMQPGSRSAARRRRDALDGIAADRSGHRPPALPAGDR